MAVLGTNLYTSLALSHPQITWSATGEMRSTRCSRDVIVAWLGRFSWNLFFFQLTLKCIVFSSGSVFMACALLHVPAQLLCTLYMCVRVTLNGQHIVPCPTTYKPARCRITHQNKYMHTKKFRHSFHIVCD